MLEKRSAQTAGNQSPIPFDTLRATGNQSPIPFDTLSKDNDHENVAGNQSPIPFDTLGPGGEGVFSCWESITNPL